MPLDSWIGFSIATTILILMPGPSIMLTVAHATAHGARQAMFTVGGAGLACIIHVLICAAGIGWLMGMAAGWFEVFRWAGVAYLVYLGVQQWRAPVDTAEATGQTRGSRRSLFTQGLLVTLSNPKALAFYAAFFPQFVDPTLPAAPQFTILGITYVTIAVVLTAGYGVLAGRVAGLLRGRRTAVIKNRVVAGVLIGAGVLLAGARRG
jgi:homoserine/homoserine lactone efflux protein